DVLRDPDGAGDSRQVDSVQYSGGAAASSPAVRPGAQGEQRKRKGSLDAGADGGAPGESGLLGVPSADGSGRLLAGKLRCGGPLANRGGQPADRQRRGAPGWKQVRGGGRPAEGAAEAAGAFRHHFQRKASDLRAGPRRGILRRSGDPQDSTGFSYQGLPFFVNYSGSSRQHAVSNDALAMSITKKALPRRTFLRGFGTALALPLLDAMVPAMTALAATPANPVRRLGFIYIPMGAHIPQWTPPGPSGPLGELSPILRSLAPFKDQLTVLTNMELKNAYPGTHATSNAAFLSAATAKWTESSDYELATTVDQIAAKHAGQETRLPSLELAMDLLTTVGQCDNGYACVYQNNLSWSSPTTPLPAEAPPR